MIQIFKIGGNVINNPDELQGFIKNFLQISGKKILVHGGGKEASEFSKGLGIEPKMINGRRVTDKETLDIVTMVYAGLINKRIVSLLQEKGCDAVGLSGADGDVIPAQKRKPSPIDFGFVGDINPDKINTHFISMLLGNENVPVFCAICRNQDGGLLNCNADSIASALALACSKLEKTNLIYCFEKPGVLKNIDDDTSIIPHITSEMFQSLMESGQISGGMIPKISNALMAINQGVNSVKICESKNILTDKGTIISD